MVSNPYGFLVSETLDKIWFKNQSTLKDAGILSKESWDSQHGHLTGYLRHKKFNQKQSERNKRKRDNQSWSTSPRLDTHGSSDSEIEEPLPGRTPSGSRARQSVPMASVSRQKSKVSTKSR